MNGVYYGRRRHRVLSCHVLVSHHCIKFYFLHVSF
jgi:hypothetical protein